ncbi:MAG: ATPase [Alphaproteobacteria bacterium 43-37]|nr:MAG: ATPase [Alphaproteobacteria bacterium 43-37]
MNQANTQGKRPYIIVIGNEKGGTGKSTISMHVIVYLLREGMTVGSIDVDARQGSLSRYIENRANFAQKIPGKSIPLPKHIAIFKSDKTDLNEAQQEEEAKVLEALDQLKGCDVIVIDTPGTDSYLSRVAHSYATTLITPLNDSLVDFDMLARVEGDNIRPSKYAEMVWEQKKNKAMRDGGSIDWIVLRNRLSNIKAKNKAEVEKWVGLLSKRIGVRTIDGLGERVIFRELFLQGLTLMDLRELEIKPTLSHIAARQEVKQLIDSIRVFQDTIQKIA